MRSRKTGLIIGLAGVLIAAILLLPISHNNALELGDITLINNPEAQETTWNELVGFLQSSDIPDRDYVRANEGGTEYVCRHFAADMHNDAEAAGIRSAYVVVTFSHKNWTISHAIVAFDTTDRGRVYFEVTSRLMRVEPVIGATGPAGYRLFFMDDTEQVYYGRVSTVTKLEYYWL